MEQMYKCHTCKETFPKNKLTFYTSLGAKTGYNYCKKCYEEKIARENFSNQICKIFGIKSPGPRIWAERKRLQDTYGYTDNTIIDCLEYVYNIERKKKFAESLYLVKPYMVERMQQWKRTQERIENNMAYALKNTELIEYFVPTKTENKTVTKFNIDDFLED